MSRVCIIPARGGSVRLPGKNIRPFFGKPMLHYPIETARRSRLFDRIIVSTDDKDVAVCAAAANAEVFMRPERDDGVRGTQNVAAEVLHEYGFPANDDACVIYATSPLLAVSDLERGLAVLPRGLYAMSVQTDPLADAGCFYWGKVAAFLVDAPLIDSHTIMVPMPANRCVDINDERDWMRAEALYAAMRRTNAN